MGGARVTDKTEKFIIRTWTSLVSNTSGKPTAKEVLNVAEAYIAKNNIKDIFLPKLRKVQQILAELQQNRTELPAEQKLMQEPWSMATLQEYPLPPESLNSVVYVWRYTLITGELFTIRQAKWVSRLYTFALDPNLDPRVPDQALILWLIAYDYAKKEEASLVSKKKFDTFHDDIRLAFTTLQATTIFKTIYGDKPFKDPFRIALPYSHDNEIMHEVIHPLDYYNAIHNGTVTNERDKELFYLIAKMPSLTSLGLISVEIWTSYLIWLTHIKKMSEWSKLSAVKASEVIIELRKWAIELQRIKFDQENPKRPTVASRSENGYTHIDEQFPTPKNALVLLSKYAAKE
jgi:hypothetical protein